MGFKSIIGAVHIFRTFGHSNIFYLLENIKDMFIDPNFLFIWFVPLNVLIITYLSFSLKKSVRKNIKYSFSFKGELTDLEYMPHIICLMILTIVPTVIFLTIAYSTFSDMTNSYSSSLEFYSSALLIYYVVLSILYINISICRLRNIGFQGKYVPIVFILSFLLIIIACIMINLPETNAVKSIALCFAITFLSVLIHFFQVLLFLLPEDFKNKINKIRSKILQ
jgi:uncharacterized membrane protein YhaH (DUF805 family)